MGKPVNIEVYPRRGERVEQTIRRFIRKTKKEKLIEQLRDLRYYEKPSVKKNKIKQRKRRNTEKRTNYV
tara:strand:- start:88 stop:294 length:207 start_codon:yes stop_codon:yes gene_type:complete